MSSDLFVRTKGLGKKFKLYDHPWHHLSDLLVGEGKSRDHWALRGADLELKTGDCLGIVGRNGAGKSTLLELICGILTPTEGRVETNGKIAALLQLGAGFNPEFTGRENVFVGASLYGLSTAQIAERFPAIAAFADIGDFIDRPVREYSSGMYARLAFAVCVHVDADILVVDEILGVGDVRFQQKSMRFLRAFRRRGIVLFVSHDEHAVAALCNKAIWIDQGCVVAEGTTKDILYQYRRDLSRRMGSDREFTASGSMASFETGASISNSLGRPVDALPLFDPDDPPSVDGRGRIESVEVARIDGAMLHAAEGGEGVRIAVSCRALAELDHAHVVFALRDPLGQIVFSGDSRDACAASSAMKAGEVLNCAFEFNLPYLPTGKYPIEIYFLSVASGAVACHDHAEFAAVVPVLSHHISSGMANLRMDRTLLLAGAEV